MQNDSMKKQNVEDIIGLTPMQQGMLFHYLKDPESDSYFEQLSFTLNGEICLDKVMTAWNDVARSNEILRTVFKWEKLAAPVQIILKNMEIPVRIVTAENIPLEEQESFLSEIKSADVAAGVAIDREPFRITIAQLSPECIEMIISYHHILMDGWSTAVLIKEFIDFYEAQLLGDRITVENKLKYKNFLKWQKENSEVQREYWKSYLDGFEDKAVIPEDFRGLESQQGSDMYTKILGRELCAALESTCQTEKITMATLLHVAWGILLQKYNHKEDIIFGTTVSGRNADLEGIERSVGLYINTLPCRIQTFEKENVRALLQRVEKEIREREPNECISLTEIQSDSRNSSGESLFSTLLVIENYPIAKPIDGQGKVQLKVSSAREATHYDMTLSVQLEEKIKINLLFQKGKYHIETAKRVVEHLNNILESIAENREQKIFEIEMMSVEEKHRIIKDFNKTESEYDRQLTLHQLFEKKAEKKPDKVAIIFGENQLTYKEVNEKANQLADALRHRGIGPDSIVGVLMERSEEMIIGIIGILKAGGAYLPIDPEYPQERIKFMLQDSGAKILLTREPFSEEIYGCDVINLRDEGVFAGRAENLILISKPEDLAYIIYTSGSTGKPKGVMIEHRNALNTLTGLEKAYPLEEEDAYLLKTSYTFDVSVTELFGWFVGGGRLVILPPGDEKDPRAIIKEIAKNHITHINFVPSMLNLFIDELERNTFEKPEGLKYVFAAGEALSAETVKRFEKATKGIQLENIYGPTEIAIYATSHRIEKLNYNLGVPIGRPMQNVRAYITDRYGRLTPIGVPGELCIAGDGLARGYLGSPELTNSKFVLNPIIPGERMYRTGDWSRWRLDGSIEYLGRMDHQVKIRGFRIELGEIENRLLMHSAIKEAIVTAREDDSKNQYLCAYITSNREVLPKGDFMMSELHDHLSRELPEYMIPSCFVQMEQLPLNRSGKVDRGALPEPKSNLKKSTEYKSPENQTELLLVEIWKKVLGLNMVGVDDHFFELGGHSLKAMQIVNQIQKVLNKQISFKEFFEHQTIAELGRYLENSSTVDSRIESLPQQDFYELSQAQKRLWIVSEKSDDHALYNMAGHLHITSKLNKDSVQKAFEQLIKRHESLRTRFTVVDGSPVQIIDDEIDFALAFTDLCDLDEKARKEEVSEAYHAISDTSFDLKKSPLLTAKVMKLTESDFEIIFCVHHIVSDGWSMNLLKEEFLLFYESEVNGREVGLVPLKIQYKDFTAWQNMQLEQSPKMQMAKEYWYQLLRDNPSAIDISHRQLGDSMQKRTGEIQRIIIEKNTKETLKRIAKDKNTSLFMVLLTAINILLMDLSGENDILMGTPGSGREHEDVEKIVGYFINTTVLRNLVDEEELFGELLMRINENTLKAIDYQSFPIEKIVEEYNIKYPQLHVFFNMLNLGDTENRIYDPEAAIENEVQAETKFNLIFYVTEYADAIEIVSLYVKELFKSSRMTSIMDRYAGLLGKIADNPNARILEYLD